MTEHKVEIAAGVKVTPEVNTPLTLGWDGASLTLAGVIYGIVVTVVGVIVAPHGTVPGLIYGALACLGLILGLVAFDQRVIAAMRWILSRHGRA